VRFVRYFSDRKWLPIPALRIALDLTSYAELAARLVNTAVPAEGDIDWLGATDAFRSFVADQAHLNGPCTHHDLDALRILRGELSAIFTAAAKRDHASAAERLNGLLVQYPVHPVLVRHDRSAWHLHLDSSGSVADRYAAAAVTGLSMLVSQFGLSLLGICTFTSLNRVFVDPGPARPNSLCMSHWPHN